MVRTLENFHFESTIILSLILIVIISFSNFDSYSDNSLMFFENQLIQYASAQTNVEQIDAPIVYDIKITLMDISDVDYANGGYSLSFWITLSSDQIDFTTNLPPRIDFVNGKIDDIEHEYFSDINSYSAKVHGTFYTNMNFRNYPIVDLSLPIIVEPVKFETHEIKFASSQSSSTVDSGLTISGLIYKNTVEETSDYTYADGDIFSRYTAIYNFETPIFSSFMVGIFPILILGTTILFLFTLNPTSHDIKAEVVAGVLIAAVFFHVLDVGESLPPLEYLTLEDKLMTSLYVLIVFVMVEIAVQRKFNEEGDYDKAKKINKKMRYLVPVVVIGSFAALYPF